MGSPYFLKGVTPWGDQDLDALEAYVRAQNPVVPPATDRIQRVVH